MKRGLVVCLIMFFVVGYAGAQEEMTKMAADPKVKPEVTLKGYIVDQACGKGMAKKENAMQKAASHTRDCALEDACSAAGYGVFSNGKYYTFDKGGSEMAKSTLEKDKREKGLAFEVKGTLDGTMLTVASLKPTKLETSKAKTEMKSMEKEKPAEMK